MVQRTQPESLPPNAKNRLAALGEKKPRTKAAQLRLLWPEIKAALDRGHTLKAVCECLEADGVNMTVYTLGSYVARMRRKSQNLQDSQVPVPPTSVVAVLTAEQRSYADHEGRPSDPLANLRKSQAKRPAFDYRPELADPDKLI